MKRKDPQDCSTCKFSVINNLHQTVENGTKSFNFFQLPQLILFSCHVWRCSCRPVKNKYFDNKLTLEDKKVQLIFSEIKQKGKETKTTARKGILTIQHLDAFSDCVITQSLMPVTVCDTLGMMTTLKGLNAALDFLHIPSINNNK
jgi:hypothetical protein